MRGERGFTLTDLLLAICFLTPVGVGWQSADLLKLKVGFGGHVLGALVGLAVGTFFAWALYHMVGMLAARMSGLPEKLQTRYSVVSLVVLIIPWIFLSVFMGDWLSMAVLKLVYR